MVIRLLAPLRGNLSPQMSHGNMIKGDSAGSPVPRSPDASAATARSQQGFPNGLDARFGRPKVSQQFAHLLHLANLGLGQMLSNPVGIVPQVSIASTGRIT